VSRAGQRASWSAAARDGTGGPNNLAPLHGLDGIPGLCRRHLHAVMAL
jgi:hypothetical protein